eukprot:Gb_35355 [translate_table: standard]
MLSSMIRSLFFVIRGVCICRISLSQNLLSASLYFNSATFQSAMLNMIPPVTFVLAAVFRQERIDMTKRHDQAKVVGTVISVGGAMVMTLWKGSMLKTVRYQNQNSPRNDLATTGSWIIGSVILFVGIMSWSIWILLQRPVTKRYPAELSITSFICLLGTLQSAVLALCIDHKAASWALKWDLKLLVIFYGGILCTGFGYFVQTWCAYKRGPIFVSMYNPLLILFSAIMEALIVGESLYVGSVVGALMIVAGLCALLWGKAKDEASTEYPLPPNTNSASVITQPLMPGAGLS